jgi:hypothetical protein
MDFLGYLPGQTESTGSIFHVGYGEIYLVGSQKIGQKLGNRPSSRFSHNVCYEEYIQIAFPEMRLAVTVRLRLTALKAQPSTSHIKFRWPVPQV